MQREFYLDNAATTKMFEEVWLSSSKFLNEQFYNPSAVYSKSVQVKREIERSRDVILSSLSNIDGTLVFTASATEANNMVVFSQKILPNKRYLFGAGEHPSVMECAKELMKRGAKVEFIPLDKTGRVDQEKFVSMLGPDVAFISIQHVSNETGAINNIAKLVKLAKKASADVKFHSDGVQAFMKFNISVSDLDVDYYTISAHKIGGSKGVGALYAKKGAKISALILGGGQERTLRSGTENVFAITSFAYAIEKVLPDIEKNYQTVLAMRTQLLHELSNQNIAYVIHGEGVPHTMNIMLDKNIRGETLVHALEARGVYVSTGSACSATKHFNQTLESMGIDKNEILASIRISLSPYMDFDPKIIAQIVSEEIDKLKGK